VGSSSEEEEEESDGGGSPPRGGIPRPRHHGPQRRLSWRLWQARSYPPPGYQWRTREHRGGARERHGGAGGRNSGTPEPSRKRKRVFSSLR
jgi:hypothetical protein